MRRRAFYARPSGRDLKTSREGMCRRAGFSKKAGEGLRGGKECAIMNVAKGKDAVCRSVSLRTGGKRAGEPTEFKPPEKERNEEFSSDRPSSDPA